MDAKVFCWARAHLRMSVANKHDRTNNGVESFHAALRRRVRDSQPNFFIFLKHFWVKWARTLDESITGWHMATRYDGQRRRQRCWMTSASKLASISLQRACSYSRYEFLSALSHMADNLPTEQLADVNISNDDETETYDVDEALAATTLTSSSSSSAPSDVVAPQCLQFTKYVCWSPRHHWHWFHVGTPAFVGDALMNCSACTFVAHCADLT